MNREKAREFFSAYHEGLLEGGLKQSFERALRADATLQSDYAAFVETMTELDAMRYEEIEIPTFLSDRIATRIEEAAERRKPAISWGGWVRGLAFGGLATAALTLGVLGVMRQPGDAQVAAGSALPTVAAQPVRDQLSVSFSTGQVVLSYRPSARKTLVVRAARTGTEIERFALDTRGLESPLENPNEGPAVFDIMVLGESHRLLVAVPGVSRTTDATGSGKILDLVEALADYYRLPVMLEAQDLEKPVSWDFSAGDARTSATNAVRSLGFSVDQRPSGMITILDR